MARTIRWGIVGCGDVTERKSGPAFQKARNSALVAVMRRDGALARGYAHRHGVPRWYDDAGALIADSEVDAVYIATPPASHASIAIACARAGKPAYVEKPMALDMAECEQMIGASRSAGLPLFVAYYRRALPRFVEVKRILERGAIGRPRFAEVRLTRPASPSERGSQALPWRLDPRVSGGGHFVDLGCHTLDLLAWLLGDVVDASGTAANLAGLYPAEDTVAASLRHASGAVTTGLWCFAASERRDTVTIEGDAGTIMFSTFAQGTILVTTAGGTESLYIEHPDPIQLPLVQSAVDELNGEGRCPSTGETAARTTWVIDRILQGHRRETA
jgi:predicted dehydrogenase